VICRHTALDLINTAEVDAVMPSVQARFDKRVNATSAAKLMPRCHRAKLVRRECSFGVENLDLVGWDCRYRHRDPLASGQ